MDILAHIPVSAVGLLVATAAVIAGAPLFAAGRRTYRLRHALEGLSERPLGSDAAGLVLVRGTVALESPGFAPLSGKPCAGWTLEAKGDGMRVGGSVHELRPFRLVGPEVSARVVPDRARWLGPVTSERTFSATETLPGRLADLLDRSAEVRWLRDRRVPLELVERALEVGAHVFVTGVARAARAPAIVESVESLELAATGTDGAGFEYGYGHKSDFAASGRVGRTAHPELWIEAAEPFERVLVSGAVPSRGTLSPPAWRLALLVLGPLLTLAGLLYLAQAATPFLAGRS